MCPGCQSHLGCFLVLDSALIPLKQCDWQKSLPLYPGKSWSYFTPAYLTSSQRMGALTAKTVTTLIYELVISVMYSVSFSVFPGDSVSIMILFGSHCMKEIMFWS